MKLIVAIVHNEDAGAIVDALLERDYRATRLKSSGGFPKKSNATVLIGVDDSVVDDVISVIRANSKSRTHLTSPMPATIEGSEFPDPSPIKVDVRGAVVFVVSVDRFERP